MTSGAGEWLSWHSFMAMLTVITTGTCSVHTSSDVLQLDCIQARLSKIPCLFPAMQLYSLGESRQLQFPEPKRGWKITTS